MSTPISLALRLFHFRPRDEAISIGGDHQPASDHALASLSCVGDELGERIGFRPGVRIENPDRGPACFGEQRPQPGVDPAGVTEIVAGFADHDIRRPLGEP